MNRAVRLVFSLIALLPSTVLAQSTPAPTAITLALTASGSTVTTTPVGTVVTLTATVSSGTTPVHPGLVQFCDALAVHCTGAHVLGSAQITSAGTATVRIRPALGSHSYAAWFVGTRIAAAATSGAVSLEITGLHPSFTKILPTSAQGTLTAKVTGYGAGAPPTGTVSFSTVGTGGSSLGTLSLGNPTAAAFQLAPGAPVSLSYSQDTESYQHHTAAADFNQDGFEDFAQIDAAGDFNVYLGKGDGTFTVVPPPSGQYLPGENLATSDFNSDGIPDLLRASGGVLLGRGDGTFNKVALSGSGTGAAIGDFNGDGIPDIVFVVNYLGPSAGYQVALGNGDGTFAVQPLVTGLALAYGAQIVAGDFNHDGRLDVVAISVGTPSGDDLVPLFGNGDGTFRTGTPLSVLNIQSIGTSDFDGDGYPELAIGSISTDGTQAPLLSIFSGAADGSLTKTFSVPVGASFPLVVGDFNGDGNIDIALPSGLPLISTLLNNGDGTFSVNQTVDEDGIATAVVGDFDGDGLDDLATIARVGPSTMRVYQSQLIRSATATLAGANAGPSQAQASYSGDTVYQPSVSDPAYISPTPAIVFMVPNHTYGDPPFALAALSQSPAPITYSVILGPARVSGSTLTLTGAGPLVLSASQPASEDYAAVSTTDSIVVARGFLAIGINSATRAYGAANPAFTATLRGLVTGDDLAVVLRSTASISSPAGVYPITLAGFTGKTAGSYTFGVPAPGQLTIVPAGTATTLAFGDNNTSLTATVVSQTSGIPSGSVTFYQGQTSLGTVSLVAGSASSSATLTGVSVPAADPTFHAEYSGDSNFVQSDSTAVPLLAGTPSSTSLSASSSGSVTDTLNLSAAPGYAGTISLACANLPANTTCSFNPASLTFPSSSNSVTLMITTGTSAQPSVVEHPGVLAVVGAPFVLFGFVRRRKVAVLLVLACVCTMVSACSGTGNSGATGGTSGVQTPAGTYTIAVVLTGSNGLSESIPLTITVR